MGNFHDARAVPALVTKLKEASADTVQPRRASEKSLAQLGEAAATALIAELPRADDPLRQSIVRILAQIGEPPGHAVTPALLALLQARPLSIALHDEIILALAHLGTKDALAAIATEKPTFRQSSNENLLATLLVAHLPESRAALVATGSMHWLALRPAALVDALDPMPGADDAASALMSGGFVDGPKVRALYLIGPVAVPVILDALGRGVSPPELCRVLGDIGDGRALDALRTCVGDKDPATRGAALLALAQLGDRERAFAPARQWLKEPEPADVQTRIGFMAGKADAIRALAFLNDRDSAAVLLEIARAPAPLPKNAPGEETGLAVTRWQCRVAALEALTILKIAASETWTDILKTVTHDPTGDMVFDFDSGRAKRECRSLREALVKALLVDPSPAAHEALLAALASNDEHLVGLLIPHAAPWNDPRVFAALSAALASRANRAAAAAALLKADPARALPLLLARLREGHVSDDEELLMPLAETRNPEVAKVLAQRMKEALEGLHTDWGWDDESLRVMAFTRAFDLGSMSRQLPRSYARCAGPAAIPLLEIYARSPQPMLRMGAAEALGDTGSVEALPSLERLVQDGQWPVRAVAAEALSHIPGPRSIAIVRSAIDDPHVLVRQAARAVYRPALTP